MSEIGALGLGPINNCEAANPPFAVLPSPAVLFHDRLARRDSLVGWSGVHNTRVCSCVRVTCTLCGSTENCDTYRSHAEDVATPGLDMPMGKAGKRRGFNPFLQGYEAT